MKRKSFTTVISFSNPTTAVFTALTNSGQIKKWSGQRGKVELAIGGTIELFDRWVRGIVLAYEPGKQLCFTWKPLEWTKEEQASIVTCLFKKTKNGTKLILKHSGFPNESELQRHRDGWRQFVFEPLKAYLTST